MSCLLTPLLFRYFSAVGEVHVVLCRGLTIAPHPAANASVRQISLGGTAIIRDIYNGKYSQKVGDRSSWIGDALSPCHSIAQGAVGSVPGTGAPQPLPAKLSNS